MSPLLFHTNPFPGIRSYEIQESHLFFGREKQVQELKRKLSETRFLAIVGSSGCGKSSLIKAGLIPELLRSDSENLPVSWKLFIIRPAGDPVGNLSRALAEGHMDPELLTARLRSANDAMVAVLSETLSKGEAGLIFIDQFEELFRFKKSGASSRFAGDARIFIDLIEYAVHQTEIPLYIVLSMRTDFLDECTEFRGLSEMINSGYYLVPRMNNEERRLAITGPVKWSGNSITEELITRLLDDVGDDPDQLPILQHAMMRTWDYWSMNKTDDQPIGVEQYLAIGTMKEALSVHLEEIYAELQDQKSKYHTEKLFKALTDITKESKGTRRPTPLGEICTLTSAREEEIIRVIDHFRSPGCAFLMPAAGIPLGPESTIDISHESIMRVWNRLKNWVEEESESAQLYLRLSKSAELYQEGKTGLWVNPELQLALQWKEHTRPNLTWACRYDPAFDRAITFLNNSKKQHELEIFKKESQQKRNLKRARGFAVILGIASLVSILFLVISLNLRFKAEASRKEALEKEKMAVSESKKAEEQRMEAILQRKISDQQQQIAEQQEMITEQQRQYAVKQQLIAQVQTAEAVQQKKHADISRQEAIVARDEAQSQRKEAVTQKQIADQERVKAEESEKAAQRLRLLAISNSMAIQALQMHSTVKDEAPALYAVTAFRMNRENGGTGTDPAIYSALSAISGDPVILRGHEDGVRSIAISQNGKMLFSCGDDSRVLRWNLDNSAAAPVKAEVPKEIREPFRSLILTRDNKWLIAGTTGGKVVVWNLRLFPKPAAVFTAHASIVNSLCADPARDRFFSCGSDGRLLQWEYKGETFTKTLIDSLSSVIRCISVNREGKQMVYATGSGEVRTRKLEDSALKAATLVNLKSPALSVAWNHAGTAIALGCQDGSIQIVDPSGAGQQAIVGSHVSGVTGVVFSPGDHMLASSGYDWSVKMAQYPVSGEKPISVTDHELWIYDILITPDSRQIISCSADKTIRIFSTQNQTMVDKLIPVVKRNMTKDEWNKMVGKDVPYQKTIEDLP